MRLANTAPDVPPRDRALVAAGAGWIAAATLLAFAARPLADALVLLVFVPLLLAAVAGCVVLVWAGAAAGARWMAGRPLGRAPHVLAAVLTAALLGAAGGGRWLQREGEAATLRVRRLTYARVVADLRREQPPAERLEHVSARGVEGVVLTAAPLRVAFEQPGGFAGDEVEWVVYDPTGAVRGGPGAAEVPGPRRDGPEFRACEPVAPAYYHCWGE